MRKPLPHWFILFALVSGAGCGGSDEGSSGGTLGGATAAMGGDPSTSPGSGGSLSTIGGTGASQSQGGAVANGGSLSTTTAEGIGGATATGTAVGTGGTSAKGGTTSTGGTFAKGGTTSTGGTSAKGGTTSTGGTTAKGGTSSTGGSSAKGGASSTGGTTTVATVAKFVGNISTGNSIDYGGLTYSKYWNQITPENAGKWGSVQSSSSSSFNWATLDAIYNYAKTKNIIFKQHAFVWGSQQPSDASSITEAKVKAWMSAFCSRYPLTKLIDVVNEPPPHTTPGYANNIGGGTNGDWKWITNAFIWARAACPDAVLILNDYNNIEWATDTSHFIDIVKKIKAGGAPIDAVGAQAHDLDHASVTTATMKTLIARLHNDTGLPVYITEYDITSTDDAAQLKLYKEHIPFFLETDYIKGITIWGWIYGQTWSQAPNSGLVRGTAPRSAMTYLMGLLGRPVPPN